VIKAFYLILLFIIIISSCNTPQAEIKYDSRGRIVTYYTSKTDTIFFEENSSVIDSLYNEAIVLVVNYVIKENKNIAISAFGHEFENADITKQRLLSLENNLVQKGLNKIRIYRRENALILSATDDGKITEVEKKAARKIVMTVVE